ncbi:MAG TPA: ATP-binding cassette domain-containing protein [Alphaproteobacteria bacterium]
MTTPAAPSGVAVVDRLTRDRRARLELIGVSLVINLLGLALPLVLLQVYDRVIPYRAPETLVALALIVIAACVIETVLRLGRAALTARLGAGLEHRLGVAAVGHLFRSDVARLEAAGCGTLFERLNAIPALRERMAGDVGLIASELAFVPLFLILLAHLGGWLALAPIAVLALLALAAPIAAGTVQAAFVRHAENEDRRSAFLISAFNAVRGIKCIAAEPPLEEQYRRLDRARGASAIAAERQSAAAGDLAATLGQAGIVATAAFGAAMVVDGALSAGALAACILLAGRALQPAQRAVTLWPRAQAAAMARDRLAALFELPVAPVGGRIAGPIRGQVSLRDVAVGVSDAGGPVLAGINLSVRPGEMVALVGPNGCGKTLLLSVIAGLARPSAGTVLIDGRPLDDHDPGGLRRSIAYLAQHETLFQGSIMDNLTMFRPHAEQRALAAAAFIGLADEVRAMPAGFDTAVGAGRAHGISRCLAQRIAIARALVDRPRLVIFDEANSELDAAADDKLKVALAALRGRCTVIIAGYRPSILRLADRIHDVGSGSVDPGGLTVRAAAP